MEGQSNNNSTSNGSVPSSFSSSSSSTFVQPESTAARTRTSVESQQLSSDSPTSFREMLENNYDTNRDIDLNVPYGKTTTVPVYFELFIKFVSIVLYYLTKPFHFQSHQSPVPTLLPWFMKEVSQLLHIVLIVDKKEKHLMDRPRIMKALMETLDIASA